MEKGARIAMLEGLYSGFSDSLKQKMYFDGERFSFTIKGVGQTTYNLGTNAKFLGCNLGSGVRDMLTQSSYDSNHVLVPGKEYTLVLCHGDEFLGWGECTKTNVRNLMAAEWKWAINLEPQAEFVFLVRTMFSHAELQMMGLDYLAVLHATIEGGSLTNQLLSRQKGGDPRVQAWLTGPDAPWERKGGFVFPLI